jgi:hypothetical protein
MCMTRSAAISPDRYSIVESSGAIVLDPLVSPGLGLGLIAGKIVSTTGEVLD